MIFVDIVAAAVLAMTPGFATKVHDVSSISVYRDLVHKGFMQENARREPAREREDAIVSELRKIGAVEYIYRILCWSCAGLLVVNAAALWKARVDSKNAMRR
jgi:hypothetical protein